MVDGTEVPFDYYITNQATGVLVNVKTDDVELMGETFEVFLRGYGLFNN